MKAASKVIFVCRDAEGFGAAFFDALQPKPNSTLQRIEASFDLSLERYGILDRKASGDIVNFIDSKGSSQVSVVLLQNYEPPVAACAVNEALTSLMGQNTSDMPTLILPLILTAQKLNREMLADQQVTVYSAQIGPRTDFTETLVAGIQEASPSLRIASEPLSCLLQLVRVLKLPTIVLAGSNGHHHADSTTDQDLEALYTVGDLLADRLGLCFSQDQIHWNLKVKTRDTQEPWHALYG